MITISSIVVLYLTIFVCSSKCQELIPSRTDCLALQKSKIPLEPHCCSYGLTDPLCDVQTSRGNFPTTTDNNKCQQGHRCVGHLLCRNNHTLPNGQPILNIQTSENHECPETTLMCCAENDIMNAPLTYISKTTNNGCGYRNTEGVNYRIMGGKENETEFGEFPWVVAVLRVERAGDTTFNVYRCGGSIINPSVVITGAHCVNGRLPEELKVRAGEWDTQTTTETLPHQDRNVSEIVQHEDFYIDGLYNDIAILFLTDHFDLNEAIQPICLPPPNTMFDGQTCYVTGWGKDDFGQTGKYSVILKKVDLPIVPRDTCEKKLRDTRVGKFFKLHESFICAGGETGKDTCKGDGGSPLVCEIPNQIGRYYQAGMVAWGIGCGDNGIPGVYASISHLRPWIDRILDMKNTDKATFLP